MDFLLGSLSGVRLHTRKFDSTVNSTDDLGIDYFLSIFKDYTRTNGRHK